LKILITGIKGFIGSQIEQTFKKKSKIFGISSDTEKNDYKKLIKKKIRPNIIFHCAGSGLVGINKITHSIHKKKNLDSTINLIKFINKIKLKNSKIIFLSSQAVYGATKKNKIDEQTVNKPTSSYGKTKLLSEKKLFKLKDNKIIILRIFSIYGIGLKKQIIWDACKKLNKKNFDFFGSGQEKRDFLNINDFIKLIILILKEKKLKNNLILNVGTGKGTKIIQLINMLKKNLKIKDKINFLNNRNKSENKNFISNNKKIKKFFQWEPTRNLHNELKLYVKWYKKIHE